MIGMFSPSFLQGMQSPKYFQAVPTIVSVDPSIPVAQFAESIGKKTGLSIGKVIAYSNMFATVLPRDLIETVASIDGVDGLYLDHTMYALEVPQLPFPFGSPAEAVPEVLGRAGVHLTEEGWISTLDAFGYTYLPELWRQGIKGSGVKVAVLDTGCDNNHPQLLNRVVKKSAMHAFPTGEDENGHATWCLTCVGGLNRVSPSGIRVQGGAPECDLTSWKVLGYGVGSGSTSDIMYAIEQAIEDDNEIISMSLGSNGREDEEEDPMVRMIDSYSETHPGVIFTIAAGNCLTGDTRVSTVNGPLPISDIKKGEKIYAANIDDLSIESRKVTNTFKQGKKKVYRVKTRTRTIKATENHPFLTIEKTLNRANQKTHRYEYNLTWKALINLSPGDPLYVAKKLPDQKSHSILPSTLAGNDVVTPELARVLGFYIGDGWYRHRTRNRGSIGFAIPMNAPYADAYKDTISSIFGLEAHQSKYQVEFHSGNLAKEFHALNFPHGRGASLTKRIPQWIFSAPRNVQISFIAGYLDADGTLYKCKKKESKRTTYGAKFESPNHELIRDIRDLAISIGLRTTNVQSRTRNITCRASSSGDYDYVSETSLFTISALSTEQIPTMDPRYQKKLSSQKITRNYQYNTAFSRILPKRFTSDYLGVDTIIDIEFIGYEETYDIAVEGVHNFIAEGLIVHNSGPEERTIGVPGASKSSIGVGSWGIIDDAPAYFSSRGPTTQAGRKKPDIVAPGGGRVEASLRPKETIYSGTSFGSLLDTVGDKYLDSYTSIAGTSMSTPHVAAILACWKQIEPDLTALDVKKLFKAKGHSKNLESGWGVIDARWIF